MLVRLILPFALAACLPVALHAADYEKDIKPLLQAKCLSCHSGANPKGHLNLSTLDGILKGGEKGPAVTPGVLRQSHLWTLVATDVMPQTKDKLKPAEKELIRIWISRLAPSKTDVAKRKHAKKAHSPEEVAKVIDAEIDARLAGEKIPASPRADDAEFLRRLHLDLVGRIPTAERAAAFLKNTDPDRRKKLTEELLALPEFGKHFGTLWVNNIYATGDPEKPVSTGPFIKWMADGLNSGTRWDALVRSIYSADESSPAKAFFAINNADPGLLAPATAQLFLGMKIECAECHDHPYAKWTQADFWGIAAFFDSIPMKKPGTVASVAKEGIIKVPPTNGNRGAGKVIKARYLEGDAPAAASAMQPKLGDWLTSRDNRAFARNFVNRLFAQLMGSGFINPVGDFPEDVVPSHPALFEFLTDEFIASGFDVKHLVRAVVASQAYQRTSAALAGNKDDETTFSRMLVKVMTPEMLYDSLTTALGVAHLPGGLGSTPRIGQNEGGNKLSFGKQPGSSSKTSKKSALSAGNPKSREEFVAFFKTQDDYSATIAYTHGIPQVLALLNHQQFNEVPPSVLDLAKKATSADQAIETLFLMTLSRPPTDAERALMAAYLERRGASAQGYQGILWILLNTNEFVLNR